MEIQELRWDSPPATVDTSRILLVVDHILLRAGLRILLEAQSGMTVVGEVASQPEALTAVALYQPNIVLVDDGVHGGLASTSGLQFISALHKTAPRTAIVLLTSKTSDSSIDIQRRESIIFHNAPQLGVTAIIDKGAPAAR